MKLTSWQEYFAWDHLGFFPFCFEVRQRADERSAADVVFAIDTQDACTDRFKVKLVCEMAAGRFTASLQFDSGVFSMEQACRLAEQLRTLIEDASNRPNAALGDLEVIGEPERRHLLAEFNDSRRTYPIGRCIHELFEDHASQTPDAVAVVYEADRLTYGELNARANQLAHHLIKSGVGPDVAVGLCLDRSISLIVGLLGILKAGGGYVPSGSEPAEESPWHDAGRRRGAVAGHHRWACGGPQLSGTQRDPSGRRWRTADG